MKIGASEEHGGSLAFWPRGGRWVVGGLRGWEEGGVTVCFVGRLLWQPPRSFLRSAVVTWSMRLQAPAFQSGAILVVVVVVVVAATCFSLPSFVCCACRFFFGFHLFVFVVDFLLCVRLLAVTWSMPCPFRFFCSFFLAMRSNRRRLPVPRYLVFLFVPSFYFSLFFSFTEFRHLGPGRWAGPFRRGREGTKKKNWKKKEAKPKIEATASRKKRTKEKEKRGRKWKRGWVMLPPRWKGGATTTTTTTTTKTTPPGNHRKWERGGRKRKCEEKITINQ